MDLDIILDLLKDHGIMGIILGICIFSMYKLSIYIKDLVNASKNDMKDLIHEHRSEREQIIKEFTKSINRLEQENKDSNEKLTDLYMDLKITLEKLMSVFNKVKY